MHKNKYIVFLLVIFLVLNSSVVSAANESREVKIWINGSYIISDVKPFIKNGHTFVPVRYIAQELGYDVSWNGRTSMVEIRDRENILSFKLNSDEALLNGESIKLSDEVVLNNERSYVPFRSISELFGLKVDYFGNLKVATIGDGFKEDMAYPISYHYMEEDPVTLDYKVNYSNNEILDFKKFDNEFKIYEYINRTERSKRGFNLNTNVPENQRLIDYRYILPSTTDPLVGSWFGRTKTMGTEEYYNEYAYITKLDYNKYQIIQRSLKDNGSELVTISNFMYNPNTKILDASTSHSTPISTGDFSNGLWFK